MLRAFIHILLAALVFFSSTGFVVQKHYCFHRLVDGAVYVNAKKCHDALPSADKTPSRSKTQLEKRSCCDDITSLHRNDHQDVQEAFFPPNLQPADDVRARVETPTQRALSFDPREPYKPPLITCNLPLRLQNIRC